VSPQAKDLIKKMLAYDPQDRLSARQCLDHEWFLVDEVMNDIKAYSQSKIKHQQTQANAAAHHDHNIEPSKAKENLY